MDGEAALLIECSPRARKRSYKDFLIDVDDLEEPGSDVEEYTTERHHQVDTYRSIETATHCIWIDVR